VYAKKIDEHLGELAYHFLESGDKDKALDYFLKAADKAQKVYAPNEAFSYSQYALDLLEEKGVSLEEKVRIVEKLGDLKGWMGKVDDCMKYWNEALTLWNQLKDKKNVAKLHAKMAFAYWISVGDRNKASEHHRLALEILENEPESIELASLYEDISHMLWRSGKSAEEVLPWTQKALELAERLGAHEVLSQCYNDLGVLTAKSGESEKASKYYEQGLNIALENNLVGLAVVFYNNLSEIYWNNGEFQKTFETAQKGSDLAKKVGVLYDLTWVDSMLAYCYASMGEMQKTISLLEDILALAKRIKSTVGIAEAMLGLGLCYRILGEWDKSLQYLMEARDFAKKAEEYQFSGMAILWLGELFMEMEDYGEAEKCLKESESIFENVDTAAQITDVFPVLARLYLKKGEIEKAHILIEKTYEYATKTKSRSVLPHVEMLRAMVFREHKNWEQSIQHFEKSLQGYKSLNAQKWQVHQFAELLYEFGLMYLDRNEEDDKEKAYSLLNQALAIYQRVDAKKKIEKIIAKKKLLTA
jgi:tetratricopeptide (TPR) repeat protein